MVAMNLIGPKPHLRRWICVGIPQMFGSRPGGTPWFYGVLLRVYQIARTPQRRRRARAACLSSPLMHASSTCDPRSLRATSSRSRSNSAIWRSRSGPPSRRRQPRHQGRRVDRSGSSRGRMARLALSTSTKLRFRRVIASEAKQSIVPRRRYGLLRRFAPLRKRVAFVAGNDEGPFDLIATSYLKPIFFICAFEKYSIFISGNCDCA